MKVAADLWRDIQPDFRTSHYLDGFAHADKKFHFKADWANPPFGNAGLGPWAQMPSLPDHWTVIEEADEAHPFRLATSRVPLPDEVDVMAKVLQQQIDAFAKDSESVDKLSKVGRFEPGPGFSRSELAAWTTLASMILNLDETVTKG